MWNQWKIFEKIFWVPKWHRNWASAADIQHTSKSSSNWHINQDWCETSGKFMRKLLKTRIFIYFGAQNGKKIGPLRPIFSTRLKVLAMSMWSNIDVKPVKTFWESDLNFDLLWGPKIAPLSPIFHTPLKVLAMSTWSNTDVKPVKTFWESDWSTEFWLIFGSKMAQNLRPM